MKKRVISFFIVLIMLLTIPSFCYSFNPTFDPKPIQTDDFIAYSTINAATITLANGQVISNAKVIGGSKNEHQIITCDVDIIFIIDTSGSMGGNRIKSVKTAASNLVSKFFQGFANSQIALISFNHDATLKTNFVNINDENFLKEKINNLNASGGTDLSTALALINDNKLSFSGSPNAKRAIITLTDGATSNPQKCANKYTNLLNEGYLLYNISLGGSYTTAFKDSSGNNIGELYTNVSTTELENIYDQIYHKIYEEVISSSIDDSFTLDCENAFFLDNNAHFTLDYELSQNALLTVEYLFDIKPNIDCTSITITDTIGNFSYDPNSKLLTESGTNVDQGWAPNSDSSQLVYEKTDSTEYVIPKYQDFQRKIVLTRIINIRSDEANVFKNLVDFSVEGVTNNGERKSFTTDSLSEEKKLNSTIYVTPPWGSAVNNNIINLLYIFLVVATFIIIIKIILVILKRKT